MSLPTCQPTPAGRTPSGKAAFAHGQDCARWPGHLVDDAHPWHDDPPDDEVITCTEGHRKCSPVFHHYGNRWDTPVGDYHADDCPASPGQRISAREYAKGRTFGRGWRGVR
jgi:hypothetical protein